MKEVREFFHTPERPMTLADMKREWVHELSPEEREEIALGIGDGSLTYPARERQREPEAAA